MTIQTIADAVAGGLLIGSAAGLLLVLSGRIAGVSGMAARTLLIVDAGPPWPQATTFVLGLVGGALGVSLIHGTPDVTLTSSIPALIAGGLLVGFGTRLGNGCTSGHGVCGLARLSPRSVAATATFVTAAMATVFFVRHVLEAS